LGRVLETLLSKKKFPADLNKPLRNDDMFGLTFDDSVTQGGPAADAQVLILIALGKHQQEAFPDGHRSAAFRTVEFNGVQALELLLLPPLPRRIRSGPTYHKFLHI
jgi:hypothetical protein